MGFTIYVEGDWKPTNFYKKLFLWKLGLLNWNEYFCLYNPKQPWVKPTLRSLSVPPISYPRLRGNGGGGKPTSSHTGGVC